jgi:hypothetical protein
MTRDQCRDAAFNLLGAARAEVDGCVSAEQLLRVLIDTTMAVAYATLAGPDRADLVTADGWCACSRKPYQHRLSPRCGSRPMPPPPMDDKVREAAESARDRLVAEGRVIAWVPSDGPGQ